MSNFNATAFILQYRWKLRAAVFFRLLFSGQIVQSLWNSFHKIGKYNEYFDFQLRLSFITEYFFGKRTTAIDHFSMPTKNKSKFFFSKQIDDESLIHSINFHLFQNENFFFYDEIWFWLSQNLWANRNLVSFFFYSLMFSSTHDSHDRKIVLQLNSWRYWISIELFVCFLSL